MKKYRIVKWEYFNSRVEYEVQKRFLGFLWWWNWLDDGFWTDGCFKNIEDAKKAIEQRKFKHKKSIVYTCN